MALPIEEYSISVSSLKTKEDLGSKVLEVLNTTDSVDYTVDSQGRITVTSIDESEKTINDNSTDTSNIVNQTTKIDTEEKTSLISQLKNNSDASNSRLEIQNDLITAQIIVMSDSNKINAEKVDAIKEQNRILKAQTDIQSAILKQELKKEQYYNYGVAKNSLEFDSLDLALYGNDTLTDENGRKIIPSHEQAKFYKKSQDHQNKIDEKNEVVKENLHFQKYGDSNLKDSENKRISPRAVKANYHAEKHIDELKANKFNWNSILNYDYDKDYTENEDDTSSTDDSDATSSTDGSDDTNYNNESIDYDIMSKVISDIYNDINDDDIPNNLKEEV